MAKFKQLYDLYRFPGFIPEPRIRGVFGDPRAVVVTLRRRRKKLYVPCADKCIGHVTTNDVGVPGISLVATNGFTSSTGCEGSSVDGAEA
jgi:hypothetical protein